MTGSDPTVGVDPDRLAVCLAVLAEVEELPPEHPDAVAVRRATAGPVQDASRCSAAGSGARRCSANDRAVTAATATGAPGRIDDETAGHPAGARRPTAPTAGHAAAGARPATSASSATPQVDAFYHQLCPDVRGAEPRAAATPAPT